MANTDQQRKKRFHIIYQTTNLVNNKIYIGAHSTDNLDDGYYGSGQNLSYAIEKYGKDSFKKQILFIFDTPEEMFAKEKELVSVDFIKRKDVYNIVEGGYGGYNQGSLGLKHLHHPDTGHRIAVQSWAIEKMIAEGWVLGRKGSSTKNTIWVSKGLDKKMISPNDLAMYINEGWSKGLPKSPTEGKVWIFHSSSNQYSLCDQCDLTDKLKNGWVRKKWAPIEKGTVWVNNGSKNLRIKTIELSVYISNGWCKGLMTSRWKSPVS